MAQISGKKFIPKEHFKSQKVTNAPNLISQTESPAPKEIMVDNKIQTGVYILSGATVASVTPEKVIPRKKKNMESLVMSPPRNYPIPNQDINRLWTKKRTNSSTTIG